MRFNLYKDVKDFYTDTYNIMMRSEAQNLIPLGNLIMGNEGKDKTDWRHPALWFMAAVSDKDEILLTALMTPPFNLTLYATDNKINGDAVSCLIKGIAQTENKIPGVMTENTLAEYFAGAYAKANNVQFKLKTKMRIHELVMVNPDIPKTGVLRLARESDMPFLPYWLESFNFDCFGTALNINQDPEYYRYHIKGHKIYILEENGIPVSMAQKSREMQTVCGVSYVYTPPYFRGKGYATSCVAAVSRLILEAGFKKCVLYTDLANPVSNSIYKKIGYNPICDSLEIKFE
ncbi:MAG: GNAT family N-acetyltransferase [Treponema sp.]|jgi:predicted GNAT family acetyltransferase|nr:GNAT family N-acetyltransferase [Treponema sp.]